MIFLSKQAAEVWNLEEDLAIFLSVYLFVHKAAVWAPYILLPVAYIQAHELWHSVA